MGMHDAKSAPAQKKCQPEHLVDAARRIESTLGIKLPYGYSGAFQSFEQRSSRSKTAQCDIVSLRTQSPRQFNRLHFGAADVQRIQQEKHFPPSPRSLKFSALT